MFGTKHLIGLLVSFISITLALVLSLIFIKKEKTKLWFLRGLIISLWTLEFVKYVMLLAQDGHIGYGNFPLQLCSIPLYVFGVAVFGRTKAVSFAKATSFFLFLPGLITIIYPSNVLFAEVPWSENYFLNFSMISFVYHSIMIFFGLYIITSGFYKPKGLDFVKIILVMGGFAVLSILLNNLIDGASYMMLGVPYGMPALFADLYYNVNPAVYAIVLIFVGFTVIFLIYLYWLIRDILRKKKTTTAEGSN
ncbi:MAG: YwaF family protein [Acholeplasmatales bacterium]|jgi:hypothetical protein|nr:YwaF family protein [Acholeplasmatales bacterium]